MSNTVVVGITGGTCAGKTLFAKQLIDDIRSRNASADYLTQDWYYYDLSHLPKVQRDQVVFDRPQALDIELFAWHLNQLKSGDPILAPSYDYVEHIRLKQGHPVAPVSVLVLDGLYLLVDEPTRNLIDVRVYLSVPDDIRLIRRIRRDIVGYGMSLEYLLEYYETTMKPMHELYVAPTAQYAHMNLECWRDQDVDQALKIVKDFIIEKLPMPLQAQLKGEDSHGK